MRHSTKKYCVRTQVQLTISHLVPSFTNLGGFFPESAAGFDGFIGFLGDELAGTVLVARSSGFLCVISDLSTLRKFFVTSEPRFSSANTAPIPPLGALGAEAGGGGGGGGTVDPEAGVLENSDTRTPLDLCQ